MVSDDVVIECNLLSRNLFGNIPDGTKRISRKNLIGFIERVLDLPPS